MSTREEHVRNTVFNSHSLLYVQRTGERFYSITAEFTGEVVKTVDRLKDAKKYINAHNSAICELHNCTEEQYREHILNGESL